MGESWLSLKQTGNLVVVTVNHDFIAAEQSQELVHTLMHRMRYHNAQLFVLNLAQVQVVCSACLGALVKLLQELEHVRGRLVLANCKPDVAMLFKVTRLDSILSLCTSVDKACAKAKNPR